MALNTTQRWSVAGGIPTPERGNNENHEYGTLERPGLHSHAGAWERLGVPSLSGASSLCRLSSLLSFPRSSVPVSGPLFPRSSVGLLPPTLQRRVGWLLVAVLYLLPASAATQQLAVPESEREQGAVTLDPRRCVSHPGQGPEMIVIAAGTFIMGSATDDADANDAERPAHTVTIVHPFALARCETTLAEFERFVEDTGYVTDAERGDPAPACYTLNAGGDGFEERADAYWDNPGFAQQRDHPVVCVSHRDATQYARWLSLRTGTEYRLPSEAEWEYAARGGSTTTRHWGNDAKDACTYANGADQAAKQRFSGWPVADCDDGAVFTAPVGSYRRNPFGLSDMLGNVWEWTQDCWHGGYSNPPGDGSAWLDAGGGDCARRVLRGGGWDSRPRNLRSASRGRSRADGAAGNVGIRLARTL